MRAYRWITREARLTVPGIVGRFARTHKIPSAQNAGNGVCIDGGMSI